MTSSKRHPSPRRLIVVVLSTLAVCGVAFGAYAFSRYEPVDMGSCPDEDIPVLAAGVEIALSCVLPPAFTFNGVDYSIGCEPVDAARVGEFLVSDGGETKYEGVREILGVPKRAAILVEDNPDPCRKGRLVAFGDRMSDSLFERMSNPVGQAALAGPLEPARSKPAVMGTSYPFKLFTLCGVDWNTDFHGSYWDARNERKAARRGDYKRLGNPSDRGTMTLVSKDRARYNSRSGAVVHFIRAGGKKRIECF